jgi:hypothetical protein
MEKCVVNKFSPVWSTIMDYCEHANEPLGTVTDRAVYDQKNEYCFSRSIHMESVCEISLLSLRLAIKQYRFTIATNFLALICYMNVSYVVGHERRSSLSCKCIVSIM